MTTKEKELRAVIEDILLANIDKISSTIANKIKAELHKPRHPALLAARKYFIQKYKSLCIEAYVNIDSDSPNYRPYYKDYKKPVGKALVAIAREELNYKSTSYSGDIYRGLGITFFNMYPEYKIKK